NPAVEHCVLEADVGLIRLLPPKVRVRNASGFVAADARRAKRVQSRGERALGLVRVDRGVACRAVTTTQLQRVEEGESSHERLIADLPRGAERREVRPLVSGCQSTGAIGALGRRE